jgi:hypothetical protein
MSRSYYSQRAGRGGDFAQLGLEDLKRIFKAQFDQFEYEGYFQEHLGYECVDAGFVPGSIGTDLQSELLLTLRKPNLWPVYSTIDNWSEDDLFDIVEFLFDHISKPTERNFHSFSNCGWHCSKFDKEVGCIEYRQKINRLLKAYNSGFELSEQGEILAQSPTGFEPLLDASLPHADSENVTTRVQTAIHKFRRHRSSIEDRRDAVRDLADVLEYLRPKIKEVLNSKDEQDLFNIANNFGIRHHREGQKTDYDKAIWLSWVFYFYLATIHAAVRLIERSSES